MRFREPRDSSLMHWTRNAIAEMRQYGIFEQKVKSILSHPVRTEQGIADGTIGAMMPFGSPTKDGRQPYRGELWVLYREEGTETSEQPTRMKKTIIAVWKYPGVSKKREGIPGEESN